MPSAERMVEQRKLVTIMALDVAGYSRASEKDDSAMVAAVGRLRTVIAKPIAPHGGRMFNTAGEQFHDPGFWYFGRQRFSFFALANPAVCFRNPLRQLFFLP